METDWWFYEKAARERGFRVVAGIDEAGRGPLAGPVVAACVVLPSDAELPGVRDSKKMTAVQREKAYGMIIDRASCYGIGSADPAEIDRMNILKACHLAMVRAVSALANAPDFLLVDGLPVPSLTLPQRAIVRGDSASLSIAAASVLAKVTRDRQMIELDAVYPEYGFAGHKGYPAPTHLAALAAYGPCAEHRRSFAPVAACLPTEPSPLQPRLHLDGPLVSEAGVLAELIAVRHLAKLGMIVLETRYRCPLGEIDIIARDRQEIVFVEVKSTHRIGAPDPSQRVDVPKRRRLVSAANNFLQSCGLIDQKCRFDVAVVRLVEPERYVVDMHRAAFSGMD